METKKALTEAAIRRLKPPTKGQVERFDALLPGFALRLSYRGTKTFIVMYRVNGRQRRATLGAWSEDGAGLTLAKAREKARRYKEYAKAGIDPVEAERQRLDETKTEHDRAASNTFEAVVESFVEKFAKPRQRTWRETRRVLRSGCAEWMTRPIRTITKGDAYKLLDGFVAAGHEAKARVTLSWLKTLWRWAAKRDIVEAPIMDMVEIEIESRHRDRAYSDDEIAALWRGANKLDMAMAAYLRLLMLTAVRRNELAGMRWCEFDDAEAPTLWTIPTARTKTAKRREANERIYLVPLSPLAARIVTGLPQVDGAEEFVFPGRKGGQAFVPGSKLLAAIREASGIGDFTFHTVRHSVATWLQDQGHGTFERGLILNHAEAGVTAGYSHGYPLELKRALMATWSDHVAALVKPGDNVELLRG